MRDAKDVLTLELPAIPGKRGRPRSGKAKSGRRRSQEYRERLEAKGSVRMTLSAAEVALIAALLRDSESPVAGQLLNRLPSSDQPTAAQPQA